MKRTKIILLLQFSCSNVSQSVWPPYIQSVCWCYCLAGRYVALLLMLFVCLFVTYVRAVSVTEIAQRQKLLWQKNNELERIWKDSTWRNWGAVPKCAWRYWGKPRKMSQYLVPRTFVIPIWTVTVTADSSVITKSTFGFNWCIWLSGSIWGSSAVRKYP